MRGIARRTLALVAACWLAVSAAPAQPDLLQVPAPILTLDQERLFDGSRVAERVAEEFERRSAELATENRRIEAELEAEELDLTKRRPGLAPEAFRALADAFDEKVQGIRAAQDAKARELQRLQEQGRQDFLRQITPVLAQIVRERGAVAVLDRRSVLLSADAIDITDEAIARINAALDAPAEPDPTPAEGTTDPAPDAAAE